jgi:hypothetical protein
VLPPQYQKPSGSLNLRDHGGADSHGNGVNGGRKPQTDHRLLTAKEKINAISTF